MLAAIAGVATMALTSAMLLFVVVFMIARLWTWIRRRDIDQFWLWSIAPEAAVVVSVVGVLAIGAVVFRFFWTGAIDRVLGQLEASSVDADPKLADRAQRLRNVAEELSIGLGVRPPELWITDDPTPNSLAMRGTTRRVLVVTTAVLELPRHEQEAMVAHELAHLWAPDAHWVTSGLVALGTARRVGTEVCAGGAVLIMICGYAAWEGWLFLWGTFVAGIGLFVTGGVAAFAFGGLERRVRRDADELADVAAVRLAKDPLSLGKLCQRLAEHDGQVGPAPTSAEHLWFELVHQPSADGTLDQAALERSRADMSTRAERAFAEAREPMPVRPGAGDAGAPDDLDQLLLGRRGGARGSADPASQVSSAPKPPETDTARAARNTRAARKIRKQRAEQREQAKQAPSKRRTPLP